MAKEIPTNKSDEKLDELARSLIQPMPRRRVVGLLVAGLFGIGLSPKRVLAGGNNANPNLRHQGLKDTPCTDDMCSRGKICGVFSLPNKWGQKGCIKLGCCVGDQFCCAGEATVHGAVGGCCAKGSNCDGGKCICNGTINSRTGVCECPPERVCGSGCCEKGVQCIDGECCPRDRVCGSTCCKAGERCIDGQCCPRACGKACCKQGEHCFDDECCKQGYEEARDAAYRTLLQARAEAERVLAKEISDLEEWYKDQLSTWNLDYADELKKCGSKSPPQTDCAQKAKAKYDGDIQKVQKQHDLGLHDARVREQRAKETAQANYDAAIEEAKEKYCAPG